MPCDTRRLRRNETLKQRMEQDKKNLQKLEQKLTSGQVKVIIGPNGAISFQGWAAADRDDLTDVCAYRMLSASNSFALKQAVHKAELMSGRKVNPQAISAGYHTHDSGKTWGKD